MRFTLSNARLSFNLSDTEATTGDSFEPLPEGWYDAVIDEVEEAESKSAKNLGKPMYVVDYKIEGGDFDGRTKREWACLWEGALFTIVSLQKAIGRPETVSDGKLEVMSADELVGKRLKLRIKHKEETYVDKEGQSVTATRDNIQSRAVIGGASKPAAKATKQTGFKL